MAAKTDNAVIVPIDYHGAGETPAVYANHVVIQHTDHEFVVTFFELLPPLMSPDPARLAKEMARIKSVPARPVARIVMAPGRAQEFVAAFQDNISKFLAQTDAHEE